VPARRKPRVLSPRNASSTIRQTLEIAGETLWVLLLVLVIGFVVAKAPQINMAIDQIGGGSSAPSARAMDASREAQIRDLQARFARYESKLVPLEKGYAQLKQRHADLLKAYAELRKAHVREATSEVSVADAHPVASP
jgi:uncharacterized protein HemX